MRSSRTLALAGLAALTLACSGLAQLVADGPTPDRPAASSPTGPPANSRAVTSAASGSVSPEILQQMEAIEAQVIELRGLQPVGPVDRILVPANRLRRIVEDDLLEDYSEEEAIDDARLLALFGLLEPGFDLWSFNHDLYSEQVAGFYDDEEAAMYVVQGAGFEGPERLTYAHEFVHALQDQTYDLDEGLGLTDEICDQEGERCAAMQALIEGDASLVEEQWLRTYATQEDIDALLSFYSEFNSPVFDTAPAALKDSFLFPYEHGLEFVRWQERSGGWARVGKVYEDPPTSTELILHPVRYPEDQPVQLAVPEVDPQELGDGWRSLDQGTLGEFDTRQILAQSLPQEPALQAAEGWSGDRYVALYHDDSDQGAWFVIQQWDTIRDAQDAFLTWRDYGEARFGERIPDDGAYRWQSDAGYARLERASNQTLWLFAPDEETIEALRSAVTFPAPPG